MSATTRNDEWRPAAAPSYCSADGEPHQASRSGHDAIHAERPQRSVGQVAGQEPHGQVGADPGQHRAEDHLAADAVAERAGSGRRSSARRPPGSPGWPAGRRTGPRPRATARAACRPPWSRRSGTSRAPAPGSAPSRSARAPPGLRGQPLVGFRAGHPLVQVFRFQLGVVPAQLLGADQHQAVHDQEDRGRHRRPGWSATSARPASRPGRPEWWPAPATRPTAGRSCSISRSRMQVTRPLITRTQSRQK